jgi:chaperonin GroES
MTDVNDAINGTLNLAFDAAKLANMQGGFISANLGPKVKNQTFRFEQGEWKIINANGPLNQAMMPMDYKGPSPVLFNLLEFMVNSGKELASIKDVLTGETPATAPVGTTMALIEQGLQVFTSIYKRIYRSLKQEFKLHAALNEKHVTAEEYAEFFDDPEVDPQADYNLRDMNVVPVSDPQSVTKAQKIAKAQAIYGMSQENPTMDKGFATKQFLEAIDAEEIDKLVPPPPPPDPVQADMARRAAEAQIAQLEGDAEAANADATLKLASGMEKMAKAGQIDAGQVTATLEMLLKLITTEHGMEIDLAGQGGVPGVEGPAGDTMRNGAPSPAGDGLGSAGVGPAPAADLSPAGRDSGSPAGLGGNQGVL